MGEENVDMNGIANMSSDSFHAFLMHQLSVDGRFFLRRAS